MGGNVVPDRPEGRYSYGRVQALSAIRGWYPSEEPGIKGSRTQEEAKNKMKEQDKAQPNPYATPGAIYFVACIYCRSSLSDVRPFAEGSFERCSGCGMPMIRVNLIIPSGILKHDTKGECSILSDFAQSAQEVDKPCT